MIMKTTFINWLKHLLASNELDELKEFKRRAEEIKVWLSEDKPVKETMCYLLDRFDYENQNKGPVGSIEDFREYIRKLRREGN